MNKIKLERLIHDYSGQNLALFLYEAGFTEKVLDLSSILLETDSFSDSRQLGEIKTNSNQKLIIVETLVNSDLSERSSRKKQFDVGKKVLQQNQSYIGGIFVFYDNAGNFRFSLVYPRFEGVKRSYNSFKRSTFFVSKEHSNKTFISQLQGASFDSFEKIKEAFSVNKVTNDFFREYKRLFLEVTDHIKADDHFSKFAFENEIPIHDVAKKLLGQIVFLYFLQRKGWLGAQKGSLITDGDKNFLRNLFIKCKLSSPSADHETSSFFNDYLEYLFYDALNKPASDSSTSCFRTKFDCQIPFLNGGLFEPIPGYSWKEQSLEISNDIFSNQEGTGILDVFDSYNFTIDENSADDQEVSVDPEMLGKVFENLLEENLRKGTGSYYTPREIVQYMVQESLKSYLVEQTGFKLDKIDSVFNEEQNPSGLEVFEAKNIDEALKCVKVVDPACGSGAFLVSLLQEIARVRKSCQSFYDTDIQTYYQIKKQTIQNSIYGVDLDPGAVDIARLRFWLSLVVDHQIGVDDIEPLPNLDYKLMQGNSLLEDIYVGDILIKINHNSSKGIDRRTIEGRSLDFGKVESQTLSLGFSESTGSVIADKLARYHHEFFYERNPDKKLELRKLIDGLESELIIAGHDDAIGNLELQIKNEPANLNQKRLQSRLTHVRESKSKWLKSKVRPYFPWKLHFSEVFESGGFDIVIGNPPYIRHERIDPSVKGIYASTYPDFHSSGADIYIYFFALALNIVKPGGVVTYITLNKWLKTQYGFSLRKILQQISLDHIIDFFELPIFEAAADTAITFIINNPTSDPHVKYYPVTSIDSLDFNSILNGRILISYDIDGDWVFLEKEEVGMLEKAFRATVPLYDYVDSKIYSGIKTGLNEAFVLKPESASILKETESKSLVKPYVKPTSIHRWNVKEDSYFLATGFDTSIDIKFPSALSYLSKFEKELKKRGDKGKQWFNLRACAYYSEFEKPKIIYTHTAKNHQFLMDRHGLYINNSCYMIVADDYYLHTFLNSSVFRWLKKIIFVAYGNAETSGRVKLDFNKMIKVPIKEPAPEFKTRIEKLALAIGENLHALSPEEIKSKEKELDDLISQMYNFTQEELALLN